ncbi:MAG: hypothetical protein AB1478_06585, partial [Nitrospirota bacterium]
LKSGMLITEVDIFTIIMGKTIEYYTKAFPNIKHHNEPVTLSEALHEMKDFAEHVTENAQPEQPLVSKYYAKKVEQLTLFIRESKEKYGVRTLQEK